MKVLVTGSCGYIGTVLTPMLLEAGHEVVGLDMDLYQRCTFCGHLHDLKTLFIDVRDVTEEDLIGFEAVIHLAGLSNDPLGDYRPELTAEINEKASIRLARLAKKVGISRFLFASSCSNYGASDDNFLTEEASFNPVTPYGVSKVQVELALSKMADSMFSPTYIRASTAYGVSPRIRFDLVTNNLTAWAFTTGKVHLKSDGTPWRPIVHIEDIARAYIAALEAPGKRCTTRLSTSAPLRRITKYGKLPIWSNKLCPTVKYRLPMVLDRTSAATGSIATRSPACCTDSSRSGPPGAA